MRHQTRFLKIKPNSGIEPETSWLHFLIEWEVEWVSYDKKYNKDMENKYLQSRATTTELIRHVNSVRGSNHAWTLRREPREKNQRVHLVKAISLKMG